MAARSRARPSLMKEDNSDETMLWNSIVEKIKRAATINKKYTELQFVELETKLAATKGAVVLSSTHRGACIDPYRIGASAERHEAEGELEALHREGIKLSEEELKILLEEPDDLIKNLETLISVRSAFENEAPRTTANTKSRNLKRRHDAENGPNESPAPTPDPTSAAKASVKGTSRSGSVAASMKQEVINDTTEGMGKSAA
jgi:SAGA-associated factor 29